MKTYLFALSVALHFIVQFSFAETAALATLSSVEGEVSVQRAGSNNWDKVTKGAAFNAGDVLKTDRSSRAAVLLADGVLIRLNEDTVFRFEPRGTNEQPLTVKEGDIHLFSRKPKTLPTLNSAAVSAAIRGTELTMSVRGSKTVIALLDGNLVASNSKGTIEANGGEEISALQGSAPTKGILLKPLEAVQWTLYYPPVLSADAPASLRQAEASLTRGDVATADTLLASQDQSADALRSIVALSRNDQPRALALAESAIQRAPNDASGHLARSYAAQAGYDLDLALESARSAYAKAPNNALVIARLAEVELALGNSKKALELSQTAYALDPKAQRVNVILGFSMLLQSEPEHAIVYFESAIEREPGLGLAYLGKGLALIRTGELEAGRAELEKAAATEPAVSILRSYLGKAYFEEEKEDLAGHEFERAIVLDPNDPTPYLYRAYNNLSQNRVVAALEDVEDSISRNDNRAVYRSSLLLDQDSAVRSAGLAQVFSSLGFNRVANVEATKAITKDYGNYAAHRFLADSGATITVADQILSERNIANLFAPLSFNLLTSSSSSASLNEYSALFERPEHRTIFRFDGETYRQLYLPDFIQAGRGQEYGYLVEGQAAFADGSYEGDVGREYVARAAFQYQISPDDKILLSGQYQDRSAEVADAVYNDTKFEVYDTRIGYQHRFDSSSQFVFEAAHRHNRSRLVGYDERESILDVISNGETVQYEDLLTLQQLTQGDVDDLRISPQYYQDGELLSLVFGGEYYHARPDRDEESLIVDDELAVFEDSATVLVSSTHPKIDSERAYLYPTWHLTPWLDVTTGVTYTHLELEEREVAPFSEDTKTISEWSPKLGAVVELLPELTFRGSYFKSVRKSALEDVGSIEPTIVGGLSQTYTDFSGTQSENYSVALDYKLVKKTYVGTQYTHRKRTESDVGYYHGFEFNLDNGDQSSMPVFLDGQEYHLDEDIVSAYINQVLSDRVVAAVEYSLDNTVNNDSATYSRIELNKIEGTLRYFDPLGWFAFTRGTWREQDRKNSFFAEDGTSSFWVFDAGLGYRFPKRHGSIVLSVNNIFDEDFAYDQSSGVEEFVTPETSATLVFSVNF